MCHPSVAEGTGLGARTRLQLLALWSVNNSHSLGGRKWFKRLTSAPPESAAQTYMLLVHPLGQGRVMLTHALTLHKNVICLTMFSLISTERKTQMDLRLVLQMISTSTPSLQFFFFYNFLNYCSFCLWRNLIFILEWFW